MAPTASWAGGPVRSERARCRRWWSTLGAQYRPVRPVQSRQAGRLSVSWTVSQARTTRTTSRFALHGEHVGLRSKRRQGSKPSASQGPTPDRGPQHSMTSSRGGTEGTDSNGPACRSKTRPWSSVACMGLVGPSGRGSEAMSLGHILSRLAPVGSAY
jgi:hypothetical protein